MDTVPLSDANRSTRFTTTAWQRMTAVINSTTMRRWVSSSCGGCRSPRRHRYNSCPRVKRRATCCEDPLVRRFNDFSFSTECDELHLIEAAALVSAASPVHGNLGYAYRVHG